MKGRLHLGLPMWANDDWRGHLYPPHTSVDGNLEDYARVFSAVEGNTTFYSGSPRAATVAAWARRVPDDFRFCFKLPARITHERRLQGIEADIDTFLESLEPLKGQLGPLMVQLPRDFGAAELPKLQTLLGRWPSDLPCAVEVRHPDFFHKGEAEKNLNAMLISHGANRVMLDVRPLFSTPAAGHPGMLQAQAEKPRCPLHVISTSNFPVVRFIGHIEDTINLRYFEPWIARLKLWISQGISPFLFVHTADNKGSPEMARRLYAQLRDQLSLPTLAEFAGERQSSLF
ncbi:DUF72 domain-containing protein [Halomonas sp. 18H]|uniref:DUF72 domain-containing protein n=1 Tax=Halomonas almeriensis TaxID=308163 RepID=UPI00223288F2|nr:MULTISPECIES: DUF72 domain-containing protein [Halomonas]MCW4152100.1 DUF72 domain-containing protein [Halomonas sp. 18H]MDN3552537.1 DUF72 domain-containing protein [Halomonas almeriensis]